MPLSLHAITLLRDTSHSLRLVALSVCEFVTKAVRRERGEEEEVWQRDGNTDRGITADEGF